MSLNGRYIKCPHFELQCAFSKHLITSILPILNGIIEYQTPYSSYSVISNISQKHWWSLLNVSLDYNIIKDQVFNHNLNKITLISKLEIVGWSNRLCYLDIGKISDTLDLELENENQCHSIYPSCFTLKQLKRWAIK